MVPQLSATLRAHNLGFLPDTQVIFNSSELEPEDASSEVEAWGLITASAALGGTQYTFIRQRVIVFLYGADPGHVDAIGASTIATAYLKDENFKLAFDSLIRDLHERLRPMRTIIDYELLSPDSRWEEIVMSAREGTLHRKYSLDLASSREPPQKPDKRG
jgi:hypothetical protein